MCNTLRGFYRILMLALVLTFISAARAQDTFAYNVLLNTSGLSASPGILYALDFEFNNGDSTLANNTVTFSGFDLGGGTTSAALPTTLTDGFANDYQDPFTPGDHISYTLTMTNAFNGDPNLYSPDEFAFSILDGNGNDINTTSPNGSFVTIDTSEVGGPQSAAAYSFGDITATIVAVPEPPIWLLFGSACVLAMIPERCRKSGTRSLRSLCRYLGR
jgi:hypothetical protein